MGMAQHLSLLHQIQMIRGLEVYEEIYDIN